MNNIHILFTMQWCAEKPWALTHSEALPHPDITTCNTIRTGQDQLEEDNKDYIVLSEPLNSQIPNPTKQQ